MTFGMSSRVSQNPGFLYHNYLLAPLFCSIYERFATMNQLPQELIDRNSRYLSSESLKNTLLLSPAFRFPGEKYSGAFIRFKLNQETADKFISAFSGHRLPYLRNLGFEIRLPLPEDSQRRDDANQLSNHDKMFTKIIAFLFATIKTVEECAGNLNGPGTVRLAISSPRRPSLRGLPLS